MLGEREPLYTAQCHPGVTAPACQLPGHHSHGPSPAQALQPPQPLVASTWARVHGWAPHTGTPSPWHIPAGVERREAVPENRDLMAQDALLAVPWDRDSTGPWGGCGVGARAGAPMALALAGRAAVTLLLQPGVAAQHVLEGAILLCQQLVDLILLVLRGELVPIEGALP